VDKQTYVKLLRTSHGLSRRAHEAEDLLQTVLLAAADCGRADMSFENNRRWVIGALKKRALFDARSALRRRQRESTYAAMAQQTSLPGSVAGSVSGQMHGNERYPAEFIQRLPPALRTTTLLALTGHDRKEIAWLLKLSDAALRQRISDIRKRWQQYKRELKPDTQASSNLQAPQTASGLTGGLLFGQLRQSMLKAMQLRAVEHQPQTFASHDPDGHVLMVSSQNLPSRQLPDSKDSKKR